MGRAENFQRMFAGQALSAVGDGDLFYMSFAVPLRLAFALAVAMLLNTKRRMVGAYRAAYYAPSIVGGSVAVAVMWRQMFGAEGVVNAVLALLGTGVGWSGNPDCYLDADHCSPSGSSARPC